MPCEENIPNKITKFRSNFKYLIWKKKLIDKKIKGLYQSLKEYGEKEYADYIIRKNKVKL